MYVSWLNVEVPELVQYVESYRKTLDVTCRCSQQIMMLPVDVPNKSNHWRSGPIVFTPLFFWYLWESVFTRAVLSKYDNIKKVRVAIMTVFHVRSTRDFRGLSMPQASYATIKRSQRGGTTDFAIAPGEAVPQWKEGRRSWTLSLVAPTRQRLREGYIFFSAGTCW
jgi:hypothetical protein